MYGYTYLVCMAILTLYVWLILTLYVWLILTLYVWLILTLYVWLILTLYVWLILTLYVWLVLTLYVWLILTLYVWLILTLIPFCNYNVAQQIFVNCRSEILQATAHVEPDVLTKALFEAAIIDELVLVDMLNERKDIREALWITVQEQLRIGQNKWKSLLEVLKQFVDEKLLSELKEYYCEHVQGHRWGLVVVHSAYYFDQYIVYLLTRCVFPAALLSLGLTGVRLEVKVYQKYKIDLFKLIEEPAELTNQLFSCGLVTKPVADEIKLCPNSALSKRMLLFAIECKLRKSMEYQLREREDAFDSLCSILKKFPSTAQLADEMCMLFVLLALHLIVVHIQDTVP